MLATLIAIALSKAPWSERRPPACSAALSGRGIAENSACIVLPSRPNYARRLWFPRTGRNTRPPTILLFTILAGSVCNCFAPFRQWRGAVKPKRCEPRLSVCTAAQRSLCGAKRKRLGHQRGGSYSCSPRREHPSDRKGASDGTHSHNDRDHGDHVVRLSRCRDPGDDLGPCPSGFSCNSTALRRGSFRGVGDAPWIIIEDRRKPALGLLLAPALARSVVGDLVAADLADPEIAALGMGEIESRDGGGRPHGDSFR